MAAGFAGESFFHPHPALPHQGGGRITAEIRAKKPSPLMGEGWVGVKKRLAGKAGGNIFLPLQYIHKLSG